MISYLPIGQESNGTSKIPIFKNQFFRLFATFELKLDQCATCVTFGINLSYHGLSVWHLLARIWLGKSLNQNKSILNGKICTRLLHVIELFVSKPLTIYVSDEIRRNSVQLFYCAGPVQVFIFAFNLSYQFEYLKAGKCFLGKQKTRILYSIQQSKTT